MSFDHLKIDTIVLEIYYATYKLLTMFFLHFKSIFEKN
jgi:hypothetical protein